MPPGDAPEQPALGPQSLVAARQPPRAPKPQPGHPSWRAFAVHEQADGAPLPSAHPVATPALEHGRELEPVADLPKVDALPGRPRRAGLAHEPSQPSHSTGWPRPRRVRASVAERGVLVLDVVVQRAVDVADSPARERDQRQPVVVVGRAVARRERQHELEQLAPEKRSGAGDGVRDQKRCQVGVVVATPRPVCAGEQPAVAIDDAGVAVHEVGVAEGAKQRLELLGVPAIVLVGEGHVRGARWGHRERALEVVVVAEPARRPRNDKARVAVDDALHLGELCRGAVVIAHHADPVCMRLRPNRLHLSLEEVRRRVVGGHADADQGPRGVVVAASRWAPRAVWGRARFAPPRLPRPPHPPASR